MNVEGREASTAAGRAAHLRHALSLEYLTVGWNLVEGAVGVTAALMAGSVALLGFGVDSFIESASGLILVWRLRSESGQASRADVDRLDDRARRLVGVSLFLLAAYVGFEALRSLWARERPEPSLVGLALTACSLAVMGWLARAKRRAASRLGSRALAADAVQTTACWWLSAIALIGLALNAAFSWWWADPVAALGMTVFLVNEGREAWNGDTCCA